MTRRQFHEAPQEDPAFARRKRIEIVIESVSDPVAIPLEALERSRVRVCRCRAEFGYHDGEVEQRAPIRILVTVSWGWPHEFPNRKVRSGEVAKPIQQMRKHEGPQGPDKTLDPNEGEQEGAQFIVLVEGEMIPP